MGLDRGILFEGSQRLKQLFTPLFHLADLCTLLLEEPRNRVNKKFVIESKDNLSKYNSSTSVFTDCRRDTISFFTAAFKLCYQNKLS